MGDWAQSPIPNPQSPIPNPQSPIPNPQNKEYFKIKYLYFFYWKNEKLK
jgi:hypothetical protein